LQPTVTKPAETKPASEDAPLKPIDSTKQPATPTTPQPTAPKPVEVTPVAPETEPILDTTDSTAIDSTKPTISAANRIPVLEALGAAYQKVRYPQRAATAYEAVLIDARQRNDVQKVEQTSITLGQLYLSWFNYLKATEIYRELLTTAQTRGNVPNEMSHLATLTYIHEQAKQPDQAIPYQLQLLALYQKLQQTEPLPRLRIQLGDNYLQADRPDLAEQNYQLAYKLAQPLLQFGNASEALQKLGALYRTNERLDAALRVYTFLVALEQQAYNAYGTMDAYDQLGQIHRLRKENAQALAAFQRGLQIAQQLKYREDYFLGQLQQIGQSSGQ
jgi:tetratricopeptide (TPR) repeat protein